MVKFVVLAVVMMSLVGAMFYWTVVPRSVDVRITLQAYGRLQGSTQTGQPVAGQTVKVYNTFTTAHVGTLPASPPILSLTTDSSGSVTFRGTTTKTYWVTAVGSPCPDDGTTIPGVILGTLAGISVDVTWSDTQFSYVYLSSASTC